MRRNAVVWLVRIGALFPAVLLGACDEKAGTTGGSSEHEAAGPLTPELASKVLAKVGDRVITLGDYQMALERLDRFSRLRYQTPERRRLLLDEMINVELLAREAERRGLDQQPETQGHIRMLQKEEMLRRLRAELPSLEELPASEVRARYDGEKSRYADPARRRVAVIRLKTQSEAKQVLQQAKDGDAKRWGELAQEHSTLLSKTTSVSQNEAQPPKELAGDLGLVSAPGQQRGQNPRVPEAVRAALFELDQPGEVHDDVVLADGAFYVVRMVGKSDARQRTFAEAENTIRVELLQERLRQAEQDLVERLKREMHVEVDKDALSALGESGSLQ